MVVYGELTSGKYTYQLLPLPFYYGITGWYMITGPSFSDKSEIDVTKPLSINGDF